jgi:hypothetical protein
MSENQSVSENQLLDMILHLVRSRSPDCFEQEAIAAIGAFRTTAREAGAREMRERCAEVCGMNNADLRDRINALPLTPADGAKDEQHSR